MNIENENMGEHELGAGCKFGPADLYDARAGTELGVGVKHGWAYVIII